MKRKISFYLFDHIINCKSSHQIWETLYSLSNKKNEAHLQILENELDNTTKGNLSIFDYFLKIKNLYFKISLLNPEVALSKARMSRIFICGLNPEYITFVTLIQGWSQK